MTAGVPAPDDGYEPSTLDDLEIEEIETWACEDTYENREKLRRAKWFWEPVSDETGTPTSLIRVFNKERIAARRLAVVERRRDILTDPTNPWSNYVSPLDIGPDSDVPAWVKGIARTYLVKISKGADGEDLPTLPKRCEWVRDDGTRCWNWTKTAGDNDLCRSHLFQDNGSHSARIVLARRKLVQASPAMVDNLEHLALRSESEPVRLGATKEILDRAGIRGGVEIDIDHHVEITDPAQVVKARLEKLAHAAAARASLTAAHSPPPPEPEPSEIVEAEVVSDETSVPEGNDTSVTSE